jgi:4-amino-4-deoxy-L-arabinose transferase-like glycosyltransferase
LYYSEFASRLAALMLASCLALVLINNDVRTDTLLTGAVMFAVWQLAAYLQESKWYYLIGAALGLALAMLAKGPIGLMVPVLGFSADWVLKRQWRNFVKPAWLILVAMVFVLLLPMLYGLYKQFGWDGWYFYFWAQSFGRLTGQNTFIQQQVGHEDHAPFFFVHTFLWSFLPWSIYFVYGYVAYWMKLVNLRFKLASTQEMITLAGFTLSFLGLSMSGYKLPYYIYVLFPFAAIISANAVQLLYHQPKAKGRFFALGILMGLLMVAGAFFIALYVFAPTPVLLLIPLGLIGWRLFVASFQTRSLIMPLLLGFVTLALVLNIHAFPQIMKYQASAQAGKMMVEKQVPADGFYLYKTHEHTLDFYSHRIVPAIENQDELWKAAKKHVWLYTNNEGLNDVERMGLVTAEVDSLPNYRVAKLSLPFLDPKQRNSRLDVRYLIKF